MNELTIGQRIASRRKLLNLSQESLAEQLHVSRQAVSKWESDATLPEIDKLIALSKLYSVSVGWLLGVEETEIPQSDAQLQITEEILRRYEAPRKKLAILKTAALILCIAAAAAAVFLHTQRQHNLLTNENSAIRDQISALSDGNTQIQTRIDQLDTQLRAQLEASKLLRSYVPLCSLSDDAETVDITFYFFPKLYQESVTAYLSILNPEAGISQMPECHWTGDRYMVHAALPLADNYRYSFLLVNDAGYEEEILEQDTYFTDLLTHSRFYIAEDHPKYTQIKIGKSEFISTAETVYQYDVPLNMPCIQEKTGFVPFEDVKITLLHNGTVIWEDDYGDDFLALYKKENIEFPLYPQIRIDLPALREGDRLILQLTATTHTGRTMVTVLDDLTVAAS